MTGGEESRADSALHLDRLDDGRAEDRRREALARARLADELARLPAWDSPALRARLRSDESAPSLGALVVCVRLALARGDRAAVQELFVLLLQRIEARNRRWAAQTVRRTPSVPPAAESAVREDLKQELTLHLWQRIAVRDAAAWDPWDPWELYFQRALAYAQRHVATAYMERSGYWTATTIASPTRVPALLLSRLGASLGDANDDHGATVSEPAAPDDRLSAADLADLRDLVERLPRRERTAVIMRFWLAASEREIAAALDVTTRTVRNALTRAYARLRTYYADEPPDAALREAGSEESVRR
jgi:RNA polymerase sigma factor (sigma-70 family)